MKNIRNKLKSISTVQWLAVALIVIGVLIMIPKAQGMWAFYQEAQYAITHSFHEGDPEVDLIRPWMSLRYIAVAYGVPQKYLYDAIGLAPRKETSVIGIERINTELGLGEVDGQPQIIVRLQQAIIAYRANPVATGFMEQEVDGWMTIDYIANSSGIAPEVFFAALELPMEDNLHDVLGYLADKTNYPGGASALQAKVQAVVDAQGVKP